MGPFWQEFVTDRDIPYGLCRSVIYIDPIGWHSSVVSGHPTRHTLCLVSPLSFTGFLLAFDLSVPFT
ncbi:hypothetical protein DBR22_20505 [Arthrobacter sp. HMWF013]|nr:hypothetical protein DBR22_20505 [Arthrobacter sp. HMWF013]